MVTVQMRQQQRRQTVRADTDGGHALLHTAAAVDQERLLASPHQG
jgi:hypothetical protein